mgnify:CR=1 FL=1
MIYDFRITISVNQKGRFMNSGKIQFLEFITKIIMLLIRAVQGLGKNYQSFMI